MQYIIPPITGTPSHFLKSQLLRPILENDSLFRLPKGNSQNFILPKLISWKYIIILFGIKLGNLEEIQAKN